MLGITTKNQVSTKVPIARVQSSPKSSEAPTLKKDTVSLGQTHSFGDSLKQGSLNLLNAAGRGIGKAAKSVGQSVLETVTEFGKHTVGGALAGAIPAALAGAAFAVAGPAIGLASVVVLGVGSGLAHHALAPENPMDSGLSPAAKSHNRAIDSLGVGTLAMSGAMMGMVNIPFPGAGIAISAATGAIVGALGSVVQQTGEAIGFIPKKAS